MMFKILLAIDFLTVLAVSIFFFIGLGDGSVSADNLQLWMVIWSVMAAIIGGGLALHRNKKHVLANLVLGLLAVPAVLYGVFIALFVLSGSTWM